jgi:hypothetical protein
VRRWLYITGILLLLAAGLVYHQVKTTPPARRNDGAGLLPYERHMDLVTVRYALPTSPSTAERAGETVRQLVMGHGKWGRLDPDLRLELLIVPSDERWPQGAARPIQGRSARAIGPKVVAVMEAGLANPKQAGLPEAVAIAITQGSDSPAYQVDWLHEGMGSILAGGWALYPEGKTYPPVAEMLHRLKQGPGNNPAAYQEAAHALAALVMDRWGLNWPVHYKRRPEEMAPVDALRWATGGADEQRALALWQRWLDYQTDPNRTAIRFEEGRWIMTAADMSPVRMSPRLGALPKGPGPNENYSPHRYELDVRYDPTYRLVTGKETLTWQNGEGIPVDALYFNLWPNAEQFAQWGGWITIQDVMVDGRKVPYEAVALDLAVPLGRQVMHGESVKVEIHFTTRLPGRITMRDFGQEGTRFNLAHWFPSLAVLDDRGWNLYPLRSRSAEPYSENTTFHVRLDVPAGMVVGATGHPIARREEGGRWIYEYEAENVKDWVATGGTDVKEYVREAEGVTIRVIERDEAWMRTVAEHVAQGLRVYNEKFGRYPYRDLVVSCCVGMEWPGLIFTIDDNKGRHGLYVIYHELAHQWFYGMVGNDQFGEPWLDEGFATYADNYASAVLGLNFALQNSRLMPAGLHVSSSSGEYAAKGEVGLASAYFQGARTLKDLEALVGPGVFDRMMKEWVRRYTFKIATTPEFIRFAEEFTGRDLKAFFEEHKVYATDRGPYRPVLPLGDAVPQ